MLKDAFIACVTDASPETYTCKCETDVAESRVYGVGEHQMAEELIKKLAGEGFTIVDLCGDFEAEEAKKFSAAAGGIKVYPADYFPAEYERVEALESFDEYGLIVAIDGLKEIKKHDLKSPGGNTYVRFITGLEAAKAAAKELVDSGVFFIELCSWFDKERTQAIIDAIDSKVPVGSAGLDR